MRRRSYGHLIARDALRLVFFIGLTIYGVTEAACWLLL